ncbi:CvpA family protein [Granulicella sp. 5B5]|nr:CvpA family protein [Granulicella sp. 5B5]
MNPLDWLLAAVLVWSVLRAFMRGFVREAFALAGLITGFLIACWNYRALAWHFRTFAANPALRGLIAFLLILFAVVILAALLGKLLSRTASAVGLGFFDRLGGALFGLLRGALFAVVLLLAVTAFVPSATWVKTSTLAPYFFQADHAVSFVMPSDLRSRLANGLDRIHRPQVF